MRLWSIHPSYLDARGLVALWREALLAQKVLRGATRGYRYHPQLLRFQRRRRPLSAIATYLAAVYDEGVRRGYRFDRTKIPRGRVRTRVEVTAGQLAHELAHLKSKLRVRDPRVYRALKNVIRAKPHPLFRIVAGAVEAWEKRA